MKLTTWALCLCVFFLISCTNKKESNKNINVNIISKEISTENINSLIVHNNAGNITIKGVANDKKIIKADITTTKEECIPKIDKNLQSLVVGKTIDKKSTCSADLTFTVPKRISVELNSHSGKYLISNMESNLKYFLGSGKITSESIFHEVVGQTGSADVLLKEVLGNIKLKTGSGKIEVHYTSFPSKGNVEIHSGSGNAHLYFPSKAQFNVKYKSGSGKLINDFIPKPDSQFLVNMRSGNGQLIIKKKI